MKTNNSDIKSLVNFITVSAKDVFNKHDISVYIMGSLARGGFSEISSDIDIGIILNGSLDEVSIKINRILSTARKNYPSVKNNISIFWGSIASLNGVIDEGRYPPFDRLDLIDHGLLLCGTDVKEMLVRPTKKELEIASALFSLDYLGNQKRIKEFHNCEYIVEKGVVYVTKTILFPARFIYLERTGKIAGNEISYQYYLDNFKGADADLINLGYFWRHNSLPKELDMVTKHLNKGLIRLYSNFINIYLKSMENYGEDILKSKLSKWKNNITNETSKTLNKTEA